MKRVSAGKGKSAKKLVSASEGEAIKSLIKKTRQPLGSRVAGASSHAAL